MQGSAKVMQGSMQRPEGLIMVLAGATQRVAPSMSPNWSIVSVGNERVAEGAERALEMEETLVDNGAKPIGLNIDSKPPG